MALLACSMLLDCSQGDQMVSGSPRLSPLFLFILFYEARSHFIIWPQTHHVTQVGFELKAILLNGFFLL